MDRPETILVVDDDPEVRRLVTLVLSGRGWRSLPADSIAAARRLLATEPVDLVILDLQLADGSGLDLLEELRRRKLSCRVIVVTGTAGLDPAIRSMTLGAVDYISKPFSPNYLLNSVEHALTLLHQ